MKTRFAVIFQVGTICLLLITFLKIRSLEQELEVYKQKNDILLSSLQEKETIIESLRLERSKPDEIHQEKVYRSANSYGSSNSKSSKKTEAEKVVQEDEEASEAKDYLGNTQKKMIHQFMEKQYQGIMQELGLDGERKDSLLSAVATLATNEGAFNLKFFDDKISNDELFEEQAQIYDDFIKELQNNFGEDQIEKILRYKENSGTKTALKMYNAYLSDLDLSSKEHQEIEKIFEQHLLDKKEPSIGAYTPEYIAHYRDKYKGANIGSPEFMKITIDIAEENNRSLLLKLEKSTPHAAYEKLKSKIEASTQMLKATANM